MHRTTLGDPIPSARRDRSIDLAKGVAIVMIVASHALRGLVASGLLAPESSTYRVLDRALYLVHVAVFAFLAGLFVRSGVQRRGAAAYLLSRNAMVVWLYLLWTLLQGSAKVLAASQVNTPMSWGDVLRIWLPDGQLWFFPWLALATTLTVLVAPWHSRARALVLLAATSAVAVATWGLGFSVIVLNGVQITPFFVLGAAVGDRGYAAWWRHRGRTTFVAVVGIASWLLVSVVTEATVPTGEGFGRTATTVALGIVGALAGASGLLAAAALAGRTGWSWLDRCGRFSLDIFLLHISVIAVVRTVLLRAGVDQVAVQLVVATVCGVALSLLLAEALRRIGLPWLFGLPSPVAALVRRVGPRAGDHARRGRTV
ncbi:hypothetical protein GCM10027053_10740 [Intrasporangium mesophilum]